MAHAAQSTDPVCPSFSPEAIDAIEQMATDRLEAALTDAFGDAYFLVGVTFVCEFNIWLLQVAVECHAKNRFDPYQRIAIDACERISRALNPALDAIAPLADVRYQFEVGSPGLYRPITTVREAVFYGSQPVLLESLDGSAKKPHRYNARLADCDPERGTVQVVAVTPATKPKPKTLPPPLPESFEIVLASPTHRLLLNLSETPTP